MKNRIIATLFCLMAVAVSPVVAQTYTVYSVVGSAKIVKGKGTSPLTARQQINNATRLMIGPETAVTVLDEKNSRTYYFASEGTHTVGELVEKTRSRAKHVSRQYMSYMVKQLFDSGSSKMSHPDTYMQVTATSYRSASQDSMLVASLTQLLPQGTGVTTEQYLCAPDTQIGSEFDVSFDLVSCDTGYLVEGQVPAGTGCYVRVHNHSDEALYVNVLDIDDQGGKYLVLPVDSAATCAHLLVPPLSTVAFKSEPFIFEKGNYDNETFVLVSSLEPVDFSILMNPIRGGRKAMKTGLYKKTLHVK